jgi:hypothetical protein
MLKNLEVKLQAPIVLFSDRVKFLGDTHVGGICFNTHDMRGFVNGQISVGYYGVEAVYDSQGEPLWKSPEIEYGTHRKIDIPEPFSGTQVVFTDGIAYMGAKRQGIRIWPEKPYSHWNYNNVVAIFYDSGEIIWENTR